MFFIKGIYCRVFQLAFRAVLPILPYREPKIINSANDIGAVFSPENTALIVTDRGIVENGILEKLETALKSNGISYYIYSGTNPNPTTENVEEALTLYTNKGCNCIIAVGGGSSIDCAKAVGAKIAYPKKPLSKMRGVLKVLRKLPPLMAVPTTAGTGSETTLAAVISNPQKGEKYAIMSFPLIPHYALLDPAFTYTLPPHLTATTGMDALTHAVEAYIGRSTTKKTRKLALKATKLVFENIETAYNSGADQTARKNMLTAAYKAGVAFSVSYVGYIHALAHSLGGKYGTPHGLANAVIMPYVLKSYGKSAHKKLYKLGLAAGVCSKTDTTKQGAEKFVESVISLNQKMGIPSKLNGNKNDIKTLAAHAEKEANPLYPVPKLFTAKQLEKIYSEFLEEV